MITTLKTNGYTNINTGNSSLPIQYQQCDKGKNLSGDKNVLLLATLEEVLGCGGWCESEVAKFYKFTDINACSSLGKDYFIKFRMFDINAILLLGIQGFYVHEGRNFSFCMLIGLCDMFAEHNGGLLHLLSSHKVRKTEKFLQQNDRYR